MRYIPVVAADRIDPSTRASATGSIAPPAERSRLAALLRRRDLLVCRREALHRRVAVLGNRTTAAHAAAFDTRARAACLCAERRVLVDALRATCVVPSERGAGRPSVRVLKSIRRPLSVG